MEEKSFQIKELKSKARFRGTMKNPDIEKIHEKDSCGMKQK